MKIKLKIVIWVSFLQIILASHLCMLPGKKCNPGKGCLIPACGGNYRIQCTIKHCAMDQTACDHYLNLKKSLFSFSDMQKFNKLMSNVRLCPKIQMQTFQPDEYCQRKNVCLVKQKMSFFAPMTDLVERVKCSCTGKHNETCGNNYCATNAFKCAGLAMIKQDQVKECPHAGQIAHSKSIKYYNLFT